MITVIKLQEKKINSIFLMFAVPSVFFCVQKIVAKMS